MTQKESYSIHLKDLKEGRHEYRYTLEDSFFEESENDVFSRGTIACTVVLIKHRRLMTMHLDMKGTVKVPCDRCAVCIDLPVEEAYKLVLKYRGEETAQEVDELEKEGVLLIEEEQVAFDLGKHLRDFSLLMIPPRRVYACRSVAPYPCDEEVLERIGYFEEKASSGGATNPSTWDVLKDIQWDD